MNTNIIPQNTGPCIYKHNGFPKIEPNPANVPEALKRQKWAVWRAEPKPEPGKYNKAPRNPKTGIKMGASDPDNFGSFDEAVKTLESGRFSGIGPVLDGNRIAAIDIDDAQTTLKANPAVEAWLKKARQAGAYCEVSPSGKGLRLFVRGKLPGKGRNCNPLEIYDDVRFMTFTGERWDGFGTEVIEGQELVDEFLALLPDEKKPVDLSLSLSSRVGAMSFNELPDALLKRMKVAIRNSDVSEVNFRKLINGDKSDYNGNPSEADFHFVRHLAECGFTPDECDMAMRVSGLMRDKWDSPRGNSTYGANTITNAFSGVEPVTGDTEALPIYSATVDNPTLTTGTLPTGEASRLKLADGLLTFSNDLPPPRDFTIQDLILAGKSVLLAGLGGVSKSQLILQAVICVALGLPFMGHPTQEGAALVLLGEEDAEEISRRVNAIAKVMRLTAEQLELVKERLRAFPMVGLDVRLTKQLAGSLEGSGLAQEIIEAAKELEVECGLPVRLIGLDHLGLIHGGDFIAREDAVQTMRQVNYIAQETRAAVVVLAHSPKSSIGNEDVSSADVAGSAGFVDQSRGVYILRTMDDAEGKQYGIEPDQRKQYVSLVNVKANYTAHGDVIWMKREVVEGYEVSVLRHVELREPIKEAKGSNIKLRIAIGDLVREKPTLTKDNLLGFSGVKDGRLRASRHVVRNEVEMMLSEGTLAFRDPTDEERKRLRIKGTTSGFLTIGQPSAQ